MDRFVGDTAIFTHQGTNRTPAANVLLLIDVGAMTSAGESVPLPMIQDAVARSVAPLRDRIRLGIMVFGGEDRGGRLIHPVSDVSSDKDFRLFTVALASLANVGGASVDTVAEALYDGQFYFNKDRGTNVAALSKTKLPPSPLDEACRKNLMIVLAPGVEARGLAPERADRLPLDDEDRDGFRADDVAGHAYAGDLSATLDDRQNIRTHVVAMGEGSALLRAVAEDGRGLYRRGGTSAEISTALNEMLDNFVVETAASFVAPAAPIGPSTLAYTQSRVYMGFFKPRSQRPWLGNLKKFAINSKNQIVDRSGMIALCPDPSDRSGACNHVAAGDFKPTAVSYWSSRPDGGVVEQGGAGGVLLAGDGDNRRIYSNLSDQRDLTHSDNAVNLANLNPTRLRVDDPKAAANLIDYLHGYDVYDEDVDGVVTEPRDWVLGDILHSRPTVIHYRRYPLTTETESDPRTNQTVIFVGGNDGMLHAFRDADGQELWAFVPDVLLPALQELSGTGHAYFVDSTAIAYVYDHDGDGNLGPGPERADDDLDLPARNDNGFNDRVILFFGLRRGGGAYYALDVTEPTEPRLLWKFDNATVDGEGRRLFPELGETWSEPQLARMNIDGADQLVAFIGAGYGVAEDSRFGATEGFPTDLAPQVGAGSVSGADDLKPGRVPMAGRGVYAFAVATFDRQGVPDITETPRRVWGRTVMNDSRLDRAIPSEITVLDSDGDDYADRLYVADLGGRLWRFAVGDRSPSRWSGEIIFSAKANEGRKVFYRPSVAREGKHWLVAFGSGDRAHPLNMAVSDRFYLVRDRGRTTASAIDENDLVDITGDVLQLQGPDEATRPKRLQELRGKDCHGWTLELNRLNRDGQPGGEKVLATPLIFNKVVYFTTYMPDAPSALSQDPCVAGNPGVSRLYAVDYQTGEAVLDVYPGNDEAETAMVDKEAIGQEQKKFRREDRDFVLGRGIPSGVVVLFSPSGEAGLLIGAEGCLPGTSATSGGVVHPLYWKEW